jgi:hypothetical protein
MTSILRQGPASLRFRHQPCLLSLREGYLCVIYNKKFGLCSEKLAIIVKYNQTDEPGGDGRNPLTCSGIRYRVKILDCEDLCLRLLAGQRGGFDRGGVGGVGGGGGGSFDGGFMGGSPMGSSLRAFFAAHATELAPALM